MEETSDMIKIQNLRRKLRNTLVIHNFNLQHPKVIYLSCEINTLIVPLFRKQLPKAKIIKFPQNE